ncbi:TetR/AcrR family transcriptional regulator [Nonomuraea roseoviolacea]|uniref:AcrR family transcriptional regulator n=1 Tax=Nonomuraea roseoviolacea subsp. carminata TaxID=160689 RepID=A0ABT1K4D1_9ACTN|nr:TetR family transcriptional regulator [Nonomuraea roseoviolacea]MCP2348321.1 AcrR family transcriptional regulator [Nonomuraea roseoviolacea subsp. carminata]
MTGRERREQLIRISRTLFAEKGFDGTSIEEIAATAQVSKPVVYEHFGGKEGVYAVVVDREMQKLLSMITEALSASHSLIKLERAALALLQYIEESSEGFRILVRDSHAASGTGSFASLISEIASQVEDVLADEFSSRGYDPKLAPMYAQMLVGMVALTGQWWLDVRKPGREEVAAHLVNLAWNGLTGLNPQPAITVTTRAHPIVAKPPWPSDKELRELEKAREKELKEAEKARQKELREAEKARVRELKERERLLKEAEKERERVLKEAEKVREREEKLRQREARLAERAARLGQGEELRPNSLDQRE